MIQCIGKYQILSRIGRGGMGSVFKAYDPSLDRAVALKIISSESDATEELRTRFFREAQACARLSHPNIVTIHDLGEADGTLFIVMELLEGEELQQIIAQHKFVHLEEKLAVMLQVCEGLDFAHQKGIVHRDVKPSNIFVLRNGLVKILDFGIAHIEGSGTGLTRAGVIMGTIRYMAPEQVRGRADQRSDIFSVGAVFHELFTDHPAFAGDNPMEVLEQIRTQDPPRLVEVDPTIPPELSAIVECALQKDPARRYAGLGKMRTDLDLVRRRLAEDAERLRREVQTRLGELRELQETLEARLGGSWTEETSAVVDERAPLATLETLHREVVARVEHLRHLLSSAESLQSAFDRGVEALRMGDFLAAASTLEYVVQEMPEHVRAAQSLEEARRGAEAQRRREALAWMVHEARAAFEAHEYARCLDMLQRMAETLGPADMPAGVEALRQAADKALVAEQEARRAALATLLREATAAFEAREYQRCLDTLQQLAETGTPADMPAGVEALRQAADKALVAEQEARREAVRRARVAAEEMLERAQHARRVAEAADAPHDAAPLWNAAEEKLAAGRTALADEAYADGTKHLEEAGSLYQRADAAVREARAARVARRADTLSDEAKRLLGEGRFAECLSRIEEVIALLPGHAGAAALRTQAEEGLRRARESRLAAPPTVLAEMPTRQGGQVPVTVLAQVPFPSSETTTTESRGHDSAACFEKPTTVPEPERITPPREGAVPAAVPSVSRKARTLLVVGIVGALAVAVLVAGYLLWGRVPSAPTLHKEVAPPAGQAPDGGTAPAKAPPGEVAIATGKAPVPTPAEAAKALIEKARQVAGMNPQEAESLLRQAIDVEPKGAQAHFQLGLLYAREKEYTKAIEEYGKAAALDPKLPDTFFNLGYAYALTKDYSKAEAMYARVVQLEPPYLDEALYNLAIVQEKQGKRQESIQSLERAVQINPDNKPAEKFLSSLKGKR
jgi:hypothetical protein